jgi:hypothetical protein
MTPDLEPSGLGHDLLTEWAPWANDDREDRHSWSVKPRIDRGYHGTPPDNYWVTDKILAPHRVDKDIYWRLVARWYLDGKTYDQITRDLGPSWPEKRIALSLVQICAKVEREFLDIRDAVLKIRRVKVGPRSPVRIIALTV